MSSASEQLKGSGGRHDGGVDVVDSASLGRRQRSSMTLAARLRRWLCVVDVTLFRNLVFTYFCVHTLLLYLSYDVPYIYGPARAVAHGMSHSAASFLISVIGISSTIGQVQARSYVQARGGSCLLVPRRLNFFETQINAM